MKQILKKIADIENIKVNKLCQKIEEGRVVVPLNFARFDIQKPAAIGEGLTVKVNANIGGSPDITDTEKELAKLKVAVSSGADAVMDLTIGESWQEVLKEILIQSPVPVGTVPVYSAISRKKNLEELTGDDFLKFIRIQGEMGVDFMTIHAGVTKKVIEVYDKSDRLGGMVSRGGKLLYRWMKKNNKENPLYENFDEILGIAKNYNITLSLGDGLRPGCLSDASDSAQYAELYTLGDLVRRCREKGVSVMVEGPGHVPLNKIKENVVKEKEVCMGAPFYVLGPLTTDIGAGYDHITGAIGGAVAAWMGADFLCYLTPAEHLHLPDTEDVRIGVIATKIAAHSGDIARGLSNARDLDDMMSQARRNLDWNQMEKYAIDSKSIRKTLEKYPKRLDNACTMCGEYCALIELKENDTEKT